MADVDCPVVTPSVVCFITSGVVLLGTEVVSSLTDVLTPVSGVVPGCATIVVDDVVVAAGVVVCRLV